MIGNTDNTWGWPAKLLHWIGAILILLLLGHGWWMTHLAPRGPIGSRTTPGTRPSATISWCCWCCGCSGAGPMRCRPCPPTCRDGSGYRRRSVTSVLYLLMLATTLVGWALAGTLRAPLNKDAFGLTVPLIYTSQDRAMHGLLEDIAQDPGLCAGGPGGRASRGGAAASLHQAQQRAAAHVVRQKARDMTTTSARARLIALRRPCPPRAQDDVAAFYKGKVVRLIVGIGVGSGYDINARLLARYLPKYIPGNPSVIVQNQPGAGSLTHDQPALRRGAVRRHRDRRLVQRPADHAAAAAHRRALRGGQAQLGRQHQPRDPGDVCLAHRADPDARRSHHQGDDRRRAGAGLDAIRLSEARGKAVRLEVQGHHRLRGDAEDPSRHGARRGARHLGELVDA